eukprot:SAG25_NODE_816_length_5227_cov_11.165367_2_plen_64_part_00
MGGRTWSLPYLHGRVRFFVLVNGAFVFADVLLERLDLLRSVTRSCTFASAMTKQKTKNKIHIL